VTTLVLAAALGLATSPARQPEPTLRLVAIYGGAAALDLGTTEYALAIHPRARESNPLMGNRPVRFAANAGFVALMTVATQKAQRAGHPNRARVLKWGFIAIKVGVAFNNVRLARRKP
jgi:hypothetical protein